MIAARYRFAWLVFFIIVALPTLLALGGIISAWFNVDSQLLSHLFTYLLPEAVANTLFLVLGVGVLSTFLGVSLAWLIAVCEFPCRRFFEWALILPMAIPGYVMAFAFVGFFDYTGPLQTSLRGLLGSGFVVPDIRSYGGVVCVLSLVLYPYIYLLARNAFQTQGRRSLEVGQSLGLSLRASFLRIALPMARPWIVGGLLLVMMETMADFGTVAIFNYDTLTSTIYKSWFGFYSITTALQVSSVLLLLVMLVVLVERYNRRAQRFAFRHKAGDIQRITLTGKNRGLCFCYVSLVLFFAFILPCLQLPAWAVPHITAEWTPQLWQYVWGSLSLATIAMVVVAALALVLAFAARVVDTRWSQLAVRISTLGYALPGTVLAVGIFTPIAAFDNYLQASILSSPLFQGTIVVMMLAYSVRFMAVAYSPIESNFLRITPSVDMAARNLGVSGFALLRKVHLPIVSGGLITAMVLVFVDVMKELPITLMTRPFGLNTLAVRVFELSAEGLWERAALPALGIVIMGLIPVILLMRTSSTKKA